MQVLLLCQNYIAAIEFGLNAVNDDCIHLPLSSLFNSPSKIDLVTPNSDFFLTAEIDRGLTGPAPRLPKCALECSISQSRQASFIIAVLFAAIRICQPTYSLGTSAAAVAPAASPLLVRYSIVVLK